MKSARITFLANEAFKARLDKEAKAKGISVAELIRQQFDQAPSADEQILLALAKELKRSSAQTRKALNDAMTEVGKTLKHVAQQRRAA